MSKKRAEEPYVQLKISVPATLAARFSLLHFDAVNRKVEYGAYSKVFTRFLADYVNREETARGLNAQHHG